MRKESNPLGVFSLVSRDAISIIKDREFVFLKLLMGSFVNGIWLIEGIFFNKKDFFQK